MINKERIILLAEEKVYSLVDKDYSDWTEEDKENAKAEWSKRITYKESSL